MKKKRKSEISFYGGDILSSPGMQSEKNYAQHGGISCYAHSVLVAQKSVNIAKFLHLRVNTRSMVRGALLHDYFLYDWHKDDTTHKLHCFTHANSALKNAERDFKLNNTERDIIKNHMFPVNFCLPKCRESWIVCTADKISAFEETVRTNGIYKRLKFGG